MIAVPKWKFYLTFIFVLASFIAFAQCEGLKIDKEVRKNWRGGYFNYFSLDSATIQLIKADSVLICYISHPDNQTNYAMPCCYFLAENYAKSELKRNLKILYKRLERNDSISLSKAQRAWEIYYKAEWEFISGAFIGYTNFSKYGQGREVMIDDASRKYQMIKDRILMVKYYIEMTTIE